MSHRPAILVGLPYSQNGRLADEAASLNAPIMVSMGSHYRANRGGLQALGQVVRRFYGDVALDSAGFVAMKAGGYQWDVSDYVDFVRRGPMARGESAWGGAGTPWRFWSSMDFCVEAEIADNAAEVARRVELTASTLGEILDEVDYWRHEEGDADLADPLPILQGQSIADYVRSLQLTVDVLADHGRTLPALLGIGSVCRRDVDGPEGLLALLRALDELLPAGVRLHLFGVKGELLGRLDRELLERVGSVDSMAWDFRARKEAHAAKVSNTVERRAGFMRRWYATQTARLDAAIAALPEEPLPTPPAAHPHLKLLLADPGGETTEHEMNLTLLLTLNPDEAADLWSRYYLAVYALEMIDHDELHEVRTPDTVPTSISSQWRVEDLIEVEAHLLELRERLLTHHDNDGQRYVLRPGRAQEAGVAHLIGRSGCLDCGVLARHATERLAQTLTWLGLTMHEIKAPMAAVLAAIA